MNRGWSAEGIQRSNILNQMVAQDRREHRDFPTWLEGLKEAAAAKKTTTLKNKRMELGSNEAGAQWSLKDDKEVALNNEMNKKRWRS